GGRVRPALPRPRRPGAGDAAGLAPASGGGRAGAPRRAAPPRAAPRRGAGGVTSGPAAGSPAGAGRLEFGAFLETTTMAARAWNPNSWREMPIRQVPDYPDADRLHAMEHRIAGFPPLVF